MTSLLRALIFPKLIEVARYDAVAVAAAGGMRSRSYDLAVVNANDDSPRATAREGNERMVRLPGQVETGEEQAMAVGAFGNVPTSRRVVVFSMDDLEEAQLIDRHTRRVLLKSTDRLAAVYDPETEAMLDSFPAVPGLYAWHVEKLAEGYGGGDANLVAVHFEDRAQGPR